MPVLSLILSSHLSSYIPYFVFLSLYFIGSSLLLFLIKRNNPVLSLKLSCYLFSCILFFVLSLCIIGSCRDSLYPGKNPIQSLFNIVFLSQFLSTLFFFFFFFFFFFLFYCALSDPLCAFKVQSGPFFNIVFLFLLLCPVLIVLSFYSVGFANCKSIFLSLHLYPFLIFPSTVLCRILFSTLSW